MTSASSLDPLQPKQLPSVEPSSRLSSAVPCHPAKRQPPPSTHLPLARPACTQMREYSNILRIFELAPAASVPECAACARDSQDAAQTPTTRYVQRHRSTISERFFGTHRAFAAPIGTQYRTPSLQVGSGLLVYTKTHACLLPPPGSMSVVCQRCAEDANAPKLILYLQAARTYTFLRCHETITSLAGEDGE